MIQGDAHLLYCVHPKLLTMHWLTVPLKGKKRVQILIWRLYKYTCSAGISIPSEYCKLWIMSLLEHLCMFYLALYLFSSLARGTTQNNVCCSNGPMLAVMTVFHAEQHMNTGMLTCWAVQQNILSLMCANDENRAAAQPEYLGGVKVGEKRCIVQ